MRYGKLTLIAAVATVAAAFLVSAGCAGSGETAEVSAGTEPVLVAPQIDASARDEVGPPPITEAERAWVQALGRYQTRYQRVWERSMTLTQASMRQLADLYGGCATTLRKAGDPGRFGPAARIAERACRRLTKAEKLLGTAISVSDAGGAVVVGTSEAKIQERALDGVFEAAGNATNDLRLALERTETIKRQIDRAASIPRGTRVA